MMTQVLQWPTLHTCTLFNNTRHSCIAIPTTTSMTMTTATLTPTPKQVRPLLLDPVTCIALSYLTLTCLTPFCLTPWSASLSSDLLLPDFLPRDVMNWSLSLSLQLSPLCLHIWLTISSDISKFSKDWKNYVAFPLHIISSGNFHH